MIAGLLGAVRSESFARSKAILSAQRADWTAHDEEAGAAVWMAATRDCGLSRTAHNPDVIVALDGILRDVAVTDPEPLAVSASTRVERDAGRVAAAYRSQRAAFLDHIEGDFAFALWERTARRAVLATDCFAQRPLYYAIDQAERLLAYASDTRMLRALAWVGSELDDSTVVNLLLGRGWEPERTPFRNIRLVPSGHFLQWSLADPSATAQLKRYWGPHFAPTGVRSRAELLDAFEQRTRQAVERRLDRSTGTAILMSGGYDSTAVAGVAAALRNEHPADYPLLHAVSATFGSLACDESARIKLALAHNRLPGSEVPALMHGLSVASIERQVRVADFPWFNIQDALLNAELDAARNAGASTVLMGLGGDDLAVDRGYDRDLLAERGRHRLWEVARAMAPIRGRSTRSVALELARAAAPELLKSGYRALRRMAGRERADIATAWLQPAMADLGWRAPGPPAWGDNAGFGSYGQYRLWTNLQNSMVQFGNRVTGLDVGRRGFGFGSPLLDRRLFELVLGTDAAWLPRTSDTGQYKPLIAEGLRAYMPAELTRTHWKVEFGSYNRRCMRSALGEISEWLFAAGSWQSERFVARGTAQASVDAFRSACDTDDAAAATLLRRVYGIVGIEAWLRQL
jgi:hypothetical protein